MSRAFVVLAGLTCVTAAPALAVDTPNALGRAEGVYTPRSGDWEFSLTAPALPVAQLSPRGLGVDINTGAGGTTTTVIGIGAGLGYCMTDLVELGGALNVVYFGGGGGGNATSLFLEPFIKANFGSGMARDSRINPFAMGALQIGYIDLGAGGSAQFTIELAGGVEFMLTHTWGISAYVPLSIIIPTASGSSAHIGLGLGYGIVAYFN